MSLSPYSFVGHRPLRRQLIYFKLLLDSALWESLVKWRPEETDCELGAVAVEAQLRAHHRARVQWSHHIAKNAGGSRTISC